MGAFTATGEALVSCQCFSTPERPSRLSPRPVVLGRVDLATGKAKVVRRLPWGGEAAAEPLACVAISRDGETVAVPDRGGNVLLLDTSTGKTRRVLEGLPGSLPACMVFSPDGTRVAEGTEDGSVVVWVLDDSASAPPATDTPAPSSMRTWTSADGNFTVEAQCVRDDGDAVVLRKKSGGEVKVPLDKLSADDRAYVERRRLRQPDAPEKRGP
jgi:WD40 repeat protein